MNRAQILKKLLLDFIRFGCFTFGGGLSIVAQLQDTYVRKEKSITDEEVLDLTSVAKSLPGAMIANVAMLYGCRTAGLAGGFLAVLGMCLPPMVILIIITFFYDAFRNNYWVNAAMSGMQAAVAPIIISMSVSLARGSLKYPPCVPVAALCLGLYLFTDVSAVLLVVIGVVSGLFIGSWYEKKGVKL